MIPRTANNRESWGNRQNPCPNRDDNDERESQRSGQDVVPCEGGVGRQMQRRDPASLEAEPIDRGAGAGSATPH